ncbi:MAG: cadmium-translocating P-type ATPase [Bacillota bacterium]|nr:cadmium-translocating P-type ATPase [Bacillota bacterium]
MNNSENVELYLQGLNCANCAAKIEKKVNSLKGVSHASLNFATKKLAITSNGQDNDYDFVSEAIKIIKDIEPDVQVINKKDKNADSQEIDENNILKREWIIFGISASLFFGAMVLPLPHLAKIVLYLISYVLSGAEVIIKAIKNITKGRVFDENFLMSIATLGAFGTGQYPEGAAVMLFYQIGELLQSMAVDKSRKSIKSLMDIRPDYANLKIGADTKKVSPDTVHIGDIIIIKPGEKVPLDGIVIEGTSMVDTSALTGESIPKEIEAGNDILSGFINKNGLLTVKVTKEFGQSTVSKILNLVENAASKKAPTENFITKFARVYTPAVTFGALIIAVVPPLILPGAVFSDWIYRALVFLVVSCPCALVVSIPLGFFGGIGGASKAGILIKGSNYLEALNNVDTVVFDKTGTLTKGVFKVTKISPKNNISEAELLEYAAIAESFSNHPIALSILKAYGKEVKKEEIEGYSEISGQGVKVKVSGKEILVGNAKLMASEDISYEKSDLIGTIVHLAVDKKYAGFILISDEVKEDSAKAIKSLREIGVKKIVMLTGDSRAAGEKIGKELGLDKVYSDLLPQDKVEKLEELSCEKSKSGKLIFVGDGINDAPVLARADVGVAMGGLGSDAAIEAADIVLMTDEPMKLCSSIKIAKRTKLIVTQNIIFALGVKFAVLLLAAIGLASMWAAVFADVGVALLAVINSLRTMKIDK